MRARRESVPGGLAAASMRRTPPRNQPGRSLTDFGGLPPTEKGKDQKQKQPVRPPSVEPSMGSALHEHVRRRDLRLIFFFFHVGGRTRNLPGLSHGLLYVPPARGCAVGWSHPRWRISNWLISARSAGGFTGLAIMPQPRSAAISRSPASRSAVTSTTGGRACQCSASTSYSTGP